MSKLPFLKVESLCKRFGRGADALTVFEDVQFEIAKGEFVCIIGHSGCGKSTILNIMAGLDRPSSGYVYVKGREIVRPGLDRGVIFQNHSLLPWKTTLGNVMFSVQAKHRGWTKAQVKEHSLKYLELVGLSSALSRRPAQLSGGMRQRVGIARAFAIEPELLLMDEPFGALDALTRGVIQDELLAVCTQTQQTVFMITHDVDEAIYLADRVLLMSAGPKAQIAEQVAIDIPRPRRREELARSPQYYDLRARMIDFLVQQSKPEVQSRLASKNTESGAAEVESSPSGTLGAVRAGG